MALFPEYMISVNSPKFPRVYAKWAVDTMTAMYQQSPTLDYIEQIEYWIGTHNKSVQEAIKSDFKKMVSKYRDTDTQNVLLCYDNTTFSLEEIWLNSRQIMAHKRLKNFEIQVISAFNLTNTLDVSLLDNCLPDINIILMSFTRPRSYI